MFCALNNPSYDMFKHGKTKASRIVRISRKRLAVGSTNNCYQVVVGDLSRVESQLYQMGGVLLSARAAFQPFCRSLANVSVSSRLLTSSCFSVFCLCSFFISSVFCFLQVTFLGGSVEVKEALEKAVSSAMDTKQD